VRRKREEYAFEKMLLVTVASVTGIWYFSEILRLGYVAKYIKGKISAENTLLPGGPVRVVFGRRNWCARPFKIVSIS